MTHFVFKGGPECGSVDAVDFFGIHFPAGVPVEITDAFRIGKARGNPTFAEAPDVNGDGVTDKAELIAHAERLGLAIDRRWGVERLRAAIQGA